MLSFIETTIPKEIENQKDAIEQLKQQRKQLSEQFDNGSDPYHLHAVTIHDGNAEMGHYWQAIKDHSKGVWRRFNDDYISELDEEDVYRFAKGGHSEMTAYWVIYIHESEKKLLE